MDVRRVLVLEEHHELEAAKPLDLRHALSCERALYRAKFALAQGRRSREIGSKHPLRQPPPGGQGGGGGLKRTCPTGPPFTSPSWCAAQLREAPRAARSGATVSSPSLRRPARGRGRAGSPQGIPSI